MATWGMETLRSHTGGQVFLFWLPSLSLHSFVLLDLRSSRNTIFLQLPAAACCILAFTLFEFVSKSFLLHQWLMVFMYSVAPTSFLDLTKNANTCRSRLPSQTGTKRSSSFKWNKSQVSPKVCSHLLSISLCYSVRFHHSWSLSDQITYVTRH